MRNIIAVIVLTLIVHVGMTKQEFDKVNGFPGVCSETVMPGMKFETCIRGDDESYNYINGKLFSWTTPS